VVLTGEDVAAAVEVENPAAARASHVPNLDKRQWGSERERRLAANRPGVRRSGVYR
jgi:hypothetical protein